MYGDALYKRLVLGVCVFEHKVRGSVNCTELHWKDEMLKTPIFPRDDSAAALPYNQLHDPFKRLGKIAGKEVLTSYCFRRGTTNVVDRKLFMGA